MDSYSSQELRKLTGITYRQLDYWARTDLLVPSLVVGHGSGSRREFSFDDLVKAKALKHLTEMLDFKNARNISDVINWEIEGDGYEYTTFSDNKIVTLILDISAARKAMKEATDEATEDS